jgi:hypothetical protein
MELHSMQEMADQSAMVANLTEQEIEHKIKSATF